MSLHAEALATLRAWDPPSAQQAELRERFVAHLEAHPDGMTRDCAGAHITCGVLVLSHDRTQVLMNLHGKAGIWVAFGGHCEPDDRSLLGAAARELHEESGLADFWVGSEIAQLDVHPVDFCKPHGHVEHFDVRFIGAAGEGAIARASDESHEVRWFPLDAVPTQEQSILDLIEIARVRAGLRQSTES